MRYRAGATLLILFGVTCFSPEAWAATVGSEFRVNTTTANDQKNPSVAPLNGGGFVVTWQSGGQDGSEFGIYGQRYSATGAKLGSEFRVNTTTLKDQSNPAVAVLSNGGFVVTWQSYQDGRGFGVYGQLYSATGAKVGGEFRINTYIPGDQADPSVTAFITLNGFVVTWQSGGQDGPGDGIYGQSYSNAGVKAGSEFRVNTYTVNFQKRPSVAPLNGGGFVVTWDSSGQDGSDAGVYAQRYGGILGMKLGSEFRVNTTTLYDQSYPSVAPHNNGGFVVVWTSYGQDGSPKTFGIYGQRYSAAGAKVGSEFRVNTTTINHQNRPSVARLADDGFVVAWMSAHEGSGSNIYGQRYSAAGAKVGSEFRVNATTANDQNLPSVAGLSGGGFVITWMSKDQDGEGWGVYGQRYSP